MKARLLARIQPLFQKSFVDGRLRFAGKILHALAIALELRLERAIDSLQPVSNPNDRALLDKLTIVIKTFERPKALKRLVTSIKRKYPYVHTIVVDDSRVPMPVDGVQTIEMSYNSGISEGRNEALRHVTSRYVLFLDDDFVFYRRTDLEAALSIMERNPQIDIMGGELVNLPFFTTDDYRRGGLFSTKADPTMPPGSVIDALPVYDKVANFFVGRTDRVRLVGWDPLLKKVEHADFFTRAKGVLTTVFNSDLKSLHAPTPFNDSYMETRRDTVMERHLLWRRYGQQ